MIPHSQTDSIDRLAQFEAAITRPYRAVMFDIDGTLTEIGRGEIPLELRQMIGRLSMQMPLSLCTGRRAKGILNTLDRLIESATDPEQARANWTIFVENGAIGLKYNSETQTYERFYETPWPSVLPPDTLLGATQAIVDSLEPCEYRINECNLGIYPLGRHHYEKAHLAQVTERLAEALREGLSSLKGIEAFRVITSGVAVHVIAADADKDRGIREFARFLREERGMEIGEEAREILIVGDQPKPGYNDEKFLEGRWGTPFTTEHWLEDRPYPIPIFLEGKRLMGPAATLSLLRQTVQSTPFQNRK